MADKKQADDARDRNGRDQLPAEEAALSARLRDLGKQLGRHQSDGPSDSEPGQRSTTDASAMARGFRLSTELVAGVLMGAGIGWLIDRWVGTKPLGMIVFLLLGFAAGVLNVMRVAGVVATNTLDPPDKRQ
jgi:ATP synthase protein I